MCPACSSRRRQQGTTVRLGSFWQTIPGPGAISSCFPPQRPSLEVDCTYLFLFYKTDMKDRAFFYVCVYYDLGFRNRKTPSENQSSAVPFDAGPEWSRMLGSAGLSGFINSADI